MSRPPRPDVHVKLLMVHACTLWDEREDARMNGGALHVWCQIPYSTWTIV
jgi:hypothetical protein